MTPLHRAVIENDLEAVLQWRNADELLHMPEEMEFSPLELAQLLGRTECQLLLGTQLPITITVWLKGERSLRTIEIREFEKIFRIVYRPFLTFASYAMLKTVINNCPYLLRKEWLATENYQWAALFDSQLGWGNTIPFYIKWIDEVLQYGFFTDIDIPEGHFIGEYTGLVRQLYRLHPDQNAYSFHYPTRFWSFRYFIIDSLQEGNALRFINHSENPNLQPVCLVDRRLLHLAFFTKHAVKKGTQLTFNYGENYWSTRKKIDIN
jgi:hypothetical protein